MKKLVLLLAVAFSVSFVSCGGEKKADEAACCDTPCVEVVEEAVAVEAEPAAEGEEAPAAEGEEAPAAEAEAPAAE